MKFEFAPCKKGPASERPFVLHLNDNECRRLTRQEASLLWVQIEVALNAQDEADDRV
jgi:hypothetical protein